MAEVNFKEVNFKEVNFDQNNSSSSLNSDIKENELNEKFSCSICNYSTHKSKLYKAHMNTPKHRSKIEEEAHSLPFDSMTKDQLIIEIKKKNLIIQDLTAKLNNSAEALTQVINNNSNNNNNNNNIPVVKLSQKTLSRDYLDIVKKIGSFAYLKGKTITIPTLPMEKWPFPELRDYYHFVKKNNFEKKTKEKPVQIAEWKQNLTDTNNNNNNNNQIKSLDITTSRAVDSNINSASPVLPLINTINNENLKIIKIKRPSKGERRKEYQLQKDISGPASITPTSLQTAETSASNNISPTQPIPFLDSNELISVSNASFHYSDIDDSSLRKQDKTGPYQTKSHIGRWIQIAVELEPTQSMTPQLFANSTFQQIICEFLEALYNSPKTTANYMKAAQLMWNFLKKTPSFKLYETEISHFQTELRAKISALQKKGNSRLQNVTEEGKIVAGKMLDESQWHHVGTTVGCVLNNLLAIPVAELSQYDVIKYKYFLWTGLQYISGGHRPQILIAKLNQLRLVDNKVYLSIPTSKTGFHTPELHIQQPMDLFLWHWVSAILPHHYPDNQSLWTQNTHKAGSKEEMDTNSIKDMFRIVLKSIFPWKTITNYTVRTFHGSHSNNPEWAAAVFTSIPIQEVHYDITNKVEKFYKVVEEINEKSGFLNAMKTGMQSTTEKNNNNNNNQPSRLSQYLAQKAIVEKVTEIIHYRYEYSGVMNFLCTVELFDQATNTVTKKEKIIIDRDLIKYHDLVNQYWAKITPPTKFPWEKPAKTKKRQLSDIENSPEEQSPTKKMEEKNTGKEEI
jgi:hypothetical protein